MRRLYTVSTPRVHIVLALGWLVAACGCNSTGPKTPTSIGGTYNLTTFNGKPLPYKRDSAGPNIYYATQSMKLTFLDAGSWYVDETDIYVNGSQTTRAFTNPGTWTLSGSALHLDIPAGQPCGCCGAICNVASVVTGTWSGNTITLVPDSASGPAPPAGFRATLVFARQ